MPSSLEEAHDMIRSLRARLKNDDDMLRATALLATLGATLAPSTIDPSKSKNFGHAIKNGKTHGYCWHLGCSLQECQQ